MLKGYVKLLLTAVIGGTVFFGLELFAPEQWSPLGLLIRVLQGNAGIARPAGQASGMEAYNFDPASRLEDRLTPVPDFLLEGLRIGDSAPHYSAYPLSEAEKKLVMDYLALLPESFIGILRERCLGIFFVKGLIGNGLATWVEDASEKIHFLIFLNPDALSASLTETLSRRENSCFITPKGVEAVNLDAGDKYKGLLYSLFHEVAHGVDFVEGITPRVMDGMPSRLAPSSPKGAEAFLKYWEDFSRPRAAYDSELRSRIKFHGQGMGPLLSYDEVPLLYSWLDSSPFVSLYGSQSWSEDFADLVTMYLITHKLGQHWRVYADAFGPPLILDPMNSKRKCARAMWVMELIEKNLGKSLEAGHGRWAPPKKLIIGEPIIIE